MLPDGTARATFVGPWRLTCDALAAAQRGAQWHRALVAFDRLRATVEPSLVALNTVLRSHGDASWAWQATVRSEIGFASRFLHVSHCFSMVLWVDQDL